MSRPRLLLGSAVLTLSFLAAPLRAAESGRAVVAKYNDPLGESTYEAMLESEYRLRAAAVRDEPLLLRRALGAARADWNASERGRSEQVVIGKDSQGRVLSTTRKTGKSFPVVRLSEPRLHLLGAFDSLEAAQARREALEQQAREARPARRLASSAAEIGDSNSLEGKGSGTWGSAARTGGNAAQREHNADMARAITMTLEHFERLKQEAAAQREEGSRLAGPANSGIKRLGESGTTQGLGSGSGVKRIEDSDPHSLK